MITAEKQFHDMINAPARTIRARVEQLDGSTLVNTFRYRDALKSFTIERIGDESKFFGYGICQKLNAKVLDKERKINIVKGNALEVAFGVDIDYLYNFPLFYVEEVFRDENTNELSVTAYDPIHIATSHTVSELTLTSYSIRDFAGACASVLGLPINADSVSDQSFNTYYSEGANFDGTETIRDALNAIAEATQTIYYINSQWQLTFKRLDVDGKPVLTIDKAKYFSLESGVARKLTHLYHITELGDNVYASTGEAEDSQFIRNNPFWELRDDIDTLLNGAIEAVGGLSINQFTSTWRGNFLLEIGDKIDLVTKDDELITSYIINDTISFNGALSEQTSWTYTDNKAETASNPATLGEALNHTYARVDKINRQIELVASETNANKQDIASIMLDTQSISASVSQLETNTNNAIGSINDEIESINKKVSATMTSEDVTIQIQTELSNGVDKVTTSTGFTFDEEGLTVSKSGSEMTTQITEDGMIVYRNDEAVLTANNEGVNAANLHATTYLMIGTNSRFEDYNGNRTGCFWIGG